MNITSIKSLDEGMPVSSITATIKKIWPTKRGTIKKGERKGEPWHVQDIVLEDDSADEITLKNWAEPLPRSDVGETFTFASHLNKKKQLSGLKIAYDDYKEENVIVMNESAKITMPDGSMVPSKPKDEASEDEPKERKSVAPTRDPRDLAIAAAEGCRISMEVSLMLAEQMNEQYKKVTGVNVTPDQINSWASSINYYLRDQGVVKQLMTEPEPEKVAPPQEAAKPKVAPAPQPAPEPEPEPATEDDEIPF